MGKIIVSRQQEWNNRLRQFAIYLDGQKLGTVANGEVKSFDIPDGIHSLKAKVDWCGSREIEFAVSPEEKKYFKLSGFKYSNIIMPTAFVIVILSLILRRIYHAEYTMWLILPIFLLLFYYLTFGRNDYLRIQQTESW
ncbi:MAG: hypothetical protein ACXVLT_08150 [Flavisolibacter sp.]